MKTMVVLFVLVLTLIGGAAAVKPTAEAKKVQEDTCNTLCLDKKEPALHSICKESCALNHQFKMVWLEAAQCSLKCSQLHGLDSPASKSCQEAECKKKYEAQEAELTASCNTVCSKVKDPVVMEKCKTLCTPALILKELKDAMLHH